MFVTGLASGETALYRAQRPGLQQVLRSGGAALASLVLAVSLLVAAPLALAKTTAADAGSPAIELQSLPAEAQSTQRLIYAGGPFPYDKDGVVFGNREKQLPARPRGHYREYTVKTPGARNRGARRIVCGGAKPVAPEVCYYSADHYASFKRIAQ